MVRRIAACNGPSRSSTTTPEAVRLADKAQFTGARRGGGHKPAAPTTLSTECGKQRPAHKALPHLARSILPCWPAGVAARGGPSVVDGRVTLASLTDRSGRK